MTRQEIIDATTGEITEIVAVNQSGNDGAIIKSFGDLVAAVISEKQFKVLSGKTPKEAIRHRPGKGGKTFAYVSHGYVTATLNKAFGFDWDWRILPNGAGDSYTYIEAKRGKDVNGKDMWHPGSIIVQGELTVRIRNPANLNEVVATITRQGFGEKEEINGFTWGALIKSAASDALKKTATLIGIALDLYYAEPDEIVPDTPLSAKQVQEVKRLQGEGKDIAEIATATGLSRGQLLEILE